MIKTTRYEDFLKQQLKNPKLRKEYDALEGEFSLAKEIIELRIKKKLTQKQLAQQIGTSQPAIARIESGSYRNVSLSFIRRVADALGAVTEIHLKRKGA
jgi:DNA-binding XRE family transcriptional regulator